MTTRWTSRIPAGTALPLMVLLAAGPAAAQTPAGARGPQRRVEVPAGIRAADSWAPRPLTAAALVGAEALGAASGLAAAAGQAARTPPARSAGSCLRKLVIAGAIGTAAGAGGAAVRLAATGGSDATGAILRKYAAIGLTFGLVGGLLACAA